MKTIITSHVTARILKSEDSIGSYPEKKNIDERNTLAVIEKFYLL